MSVFFTPGAHFCAFARKNMQTEGAWEMSVDEFLDKAMYSIEHGCTRDSQCWGLTPEIAFLTTILT